LAICRKRRFFEQRVREEPLAIRDTRRRMPNGELRSRALKSPRTFLFRREGLNDRQRLLACSAFRRHSFATELIWFDVWHSVAVPHPVRGVE
jgi:hypothetical protein